jgi:hypothetical protein
MRFAKVKVETKGQGRAAKRIARLMGNAHAR